MCSRVANGNYSKTKVKIVMVIRMKLPNRKPTRLKNYDYNQDGYYFITICSENKAKNFGNIVGDGVFDVPKMQLSENGQIINKYILSSNNIPEIMVDKYCIMPNHIHLVLIVENTGGTSKAPSPTNNIISHTISTFKRFVNKEAGQNVFQRSFHDHIIRDESDYLKICNYIDLNPQKWPEDKFYVE